MKRATGIHFSSRALRMVCLERASDHTRLCAMAEAEIPVPFSAATLRQPSARKQLSACIARVFQDLQADPGEVVPALGGGLFQMQKVPLEVASEEDRWQQITWEVSQAQISPADEFQVQFYPAGRAAFWVAVRLEVLDLCAGMFADRAPGRWEVEPVALYYACDLAGFWATGRRAAVLFDFPWLSFVSAEDGLLTAAETACVRWKTQDETVEAGPAPEPAEQQEVFDAVRRWVYGDRPAERSLTAYNRIFYCGEPDRADPHVLRLKTSAPLPLEPLRPFSACDTRHMPPEQRSFLTNSSDFGIAAGLAYRGLIEESP